METIELKDVMNQLPVADLVKNLAGVDKNGVPSQFTMENIAAVVGESSINLISINTDQRLDIKIKSGAIFILSAYFGRSELFIKDYSIFTGLTKSFDRHKDIQIICTSDTFSILNTGQEKLPFYYRTFVLY